MLKLALDGEEEGPDRPKAPPPPQAPAAVGLRRLTRFNRRIFAALYAKCRRETTFGAYANLVLFLLFRLIVVLKLARARWQQVLHSAKAPLRRLSSPPPAAPPRPALPWELPLAQPTSRAYVPERITIIAELSIPQCKRYRVDQKLAALRALGYAAEAVSFVDQAACLRLVPFSRAVVLYRTPLWPSVQTVLDECRRLAIPVLYDIDDLVFDLDEYAKHPVLAALPPEETANLLSGARSYGACLAAADFGLASTETLATWMRKHCPGPVYVVENALDELSLAARDATAARNGHLATVTIGYGSGTKSHDADFTVVERALVRLLDKHAHVRLALHGYLVLPDSLRAFSARIHRIPFLAAPQYLQAVGSFDVNLAPLEENVFNDAKSNIKFLEASVMGVPTVASNTTTYRDVIRSGVNGFLARTEAEWFEVLDRLVQDAPTRQRIAAQARADVMRDYGPERTRRSLAGVLAAVLPPRPAPTGKPRLLFVNCLYRPFSFGGATLIVEHLAASLGAQWDVAVCTTTNLAHLPAYGAVRYDSDGTHVFALKPANAMLDSRAYSDPAMAEAFAHVLAAFRPDWVHFHSIQGFGADILTQARRFGAKTAVTHHDAWWVCERQFLVMPDHKSCFQRTIDLRICAGCTGHADFTYERSRALAAVLATADLHLAPSQFQSQLIQDNLALGRRVYCNKNGVQLPPAPPPPRRVDPANVRLAFVGGGTASHKGYFVLKQIMESLTETNYTLTLTDIHLRIGPPGIDAGSWRINGKLRVVKPYCQADMDAFYAGVDVLIFPSQWDESFGMSVREALARNVWVIATRSGGVVEDLLDGQNGDLVDIGDLAGLQRKIQAVLTAPARLSGYVAPNRDRIRGFAEQAAELSALLKEHGNT